MKTTLQVLREAREWLGDKGNWTTMDVMSPTGQTCAMGAVCRVLGLTRSNIMDWLDLVAGGVGLEAVIALDSVIGFLELPVTVTKGEKFYGGYTERHLKVALANNKLGYGTIIQMFDMAIAKLEVEEVLKAEEGGESGGVSMTTLETLKAAREYIADPDHWIAGLRWEGRRNCAIGVLERVMKVDQYDLGMGIPFTEAIHLLAEAARSMGTREAPVYVVPGSSDVPLLADTWAVANLNNDKGHAACVQMYDLAIASLEGVDA